MQIINPFRRYIMMHFEGAASCRPQPCMTKSLSTKSSILLVTATTHQFDLHQKGLTKWATNHTTVFNLLVAVGILLEGIFVKAKQIRL